MTDLNQNSVQYDFERDRLRKIAKGQRIIMLFILLFIPIILMLFALMRSQFPAVLNIAFALAAFGYILFSYVHMILLANRVSGAGMASITALVFLIFPPIGYLFLVVINSWASKQLKKAGFKVGLLGVNPNEFRGNN